VKINILLVTYNHEKFVREAMDGLFIQSYPGNMEVIVADDASTDETISAIREYEGKDPRITFKFLDSSYNRGTSAGLPRAMRITWRFSRAMIIGRPLRN
jgi:glycosyltransferase involved in cell wall biosynthesis